MTSHDECVASWAKAYKDAGWLVHADIQGYQAPPEIHNKKPDIYARSGNIAHLLEVETDESIYTEHAKRQIAVFKIWADQGQKRSFRLILANSKGCNEVSSIL
ncbi:hypothetical protein JXL21_06405 [Candidatus Bathyarchaeota archaeon]|nr:hypothetical protein [Candidatus Bathyarchaeota archaeon]